MPPVQVPGTVATGYPGVLFRVGDSHSRQHLPKDLFLFEHTPPFVLAVVATGPETQPG